MTAPPDAPTLTARLKLSDAVVEVARSWHETHWSGDGNARCDLCSAIAAYDATKAKHGGDT